MPPSEHHLSVGRTARYFTLGEAGPRLSQVWFVAHGFGQLAGYFIRHFATLDDGTRLIVAPEALSRFYLGEVTGATSAGARVGATWMTREDRLAEIEDYVRYLDALHAHVMTGVARAAKVIVLGFSQGVATVCRWVARGAVRPDALILWAGTLPPELDSPADLEPFRRLDLALVVGSGDPAANPAAVAELEGRLSKHAITYRLVRFDGGHEIDAEVLKALAR